MSSLSNAKETLRRLRDDHGVQSVIVMFSGGKDSVTCLDLAAEIFERVVCVFWYVVPGLQCVERPVAALAQRYGAELIKVPHFSLAMALKQAEFCPHRNGAAHTLREIKYVDVEAYARQKAGAEWVLLGQRKIDSLERRGMISAIERTNGGLPIDKKTRRVYPIASWSDRDVYAYVRGKKIQTTPRFGDGRNSEIGFEASTLIELRDKYPEDYARLLEFYPYAEAILKREEYRAKRGG